GNLDPRSPFHLMDLQARMERQFAKKRPAPALKPPQAAILDFVPAGRRLEEYSLQKLTMKARMVAVLLERGHPLDLEEIARRLSQAGVPISQGVTTLRKAWRADPILRQRLDGRLEVNFHHPYYWIF